MATILSPAHFLGWANPTRIRLAEILAERGELSVLELARELRVSQPRVSWHLRILRKAQIVSTRRSGREVLCSLDVESIRHHQEHLSRLLTGRGAAGSSRPRTEGAAVAQAQEVT